MVTKLAKVLVGKRERNEIGYYKKLKYVEDKLREFIMGILMALIVALILALMVAKGVSSDTTGHYEPDGYDTYGNLIDTDGDGDYHHWVEE